MLFQQVRVEAKEKGFLVNILTESSCPGLLVFILEAFEELGLDVLQARVSCSSSFHLEAVGGQVRDQNPFACFTFTQHQQLYLHKDQHIYYGPICK